MRLKKNTQYYIVAADVLPEAMVRTAQAKEALAKGKAATVNQAVEEAGISRSAFYKYRDGIFPFYQGAKEMIVTVNLILEHRFGTLSGVINAIADAHGNILTINQSLPLQGMANLTVSLDTVNMELNMEELLDRLLALNGVIKAELVGQSA